MSDFDLSQALESSPESDESCCFNMKGVNEETFRLDEGLELVVSCDPMTMQCVANLLMAVIRIKRSITCDGRKLSDNELCSAIMDSLVEETIIEKMENPSTQVKKIFRRDSSIQLITMCDQRKKVVVHPLEGCTLQAITLKGGNSERKVKFKLSKYTVFPVSDGDGQVVLLSIPNYNMHFSCTMKADKAVLNLEECSEEKLCSFNEDGNMDRFLFYKRTSGTSVTTFESIQCRGWYISTYEDEDQPVEMCKVDASKRFTTFSINS